jgi:hypothetical protein
MTTMAKSRVNRLLHKLDLQYATVNKRSPECCRATYLQKVK